MNVIGEHVDYNGGWVLPAAIARHVVTENERTWRTVAALRDGEVVDAGQQLNLSHESLRKDYRVSCAELDFIVEFVQALPAVVGCRMMGGGFGGSCVAIVRSESAAIVADQLAEAFASRFGYPTNHFITSTAADAGIILAE